MEKKVKHYTNKPVVTSALIIANIAVFLYLAWIGNVADSNFMLAHGAMLPAAFRAGEWWRLYSCMFLHFGIDHILNNMVMLACVGSEVERAYGHVRYLILYFLAGTGSGLLSFWWMETSGDIAVSAGASGAIFGLLGALLALVVIHKGKYKSISLPRILLAIALAVYSGLTSAGVDNAGHIGGLITGAVFGVILYYTKKKEKSKE